MKLGGIRVGLLVGLIAGVGYGDIYAAAALRVARSGIWLPAARVGAGAPVRTFVSEPGYSTRSLDYLVRCSGAQLFVMPPSFVAPHGLWLTAEMRRVLNLFERASLKAATASYPHEANELCRHISSRLEELFGVGGLMSVEGFASGRRCTVIVGGDAYKKVFPAGVAFTSLLAAQPMSKRVIDEGPDAAKVPVCEVTNINLVFPPACPADIVARFRERVIPQYERLFKTWPTVELNGTFFMHENGEGALVPYAEGAAATMKVRTVCMSLDLVLLPGKNVEIQLVYPAVK